MSELFPTLAEAERQHVEAAMRIANGDKKVAAKMLGICLKTLYNKH